MALNHDKVIAKKYRVNRGKLERQPLEQKPLYDKNTTSHPERFLDKIMKPASIHPLFEYKKNTTRLSYMNKQKNHLSWSVFLSICVCPWKHIFYINRFAEIIRKV